MRGRLDNVAIERRLMAVERMESAGSAAAGGVPTVWVVTEVDAGNGACTVQPRGDGGTPVGPEISGVVYDPEPAVGDLGVLTRMSTGELFFFRRYGAGPSPLGWTTAAGMGSLNIRGFGVASRLTLYAARRWPASLGIERRGLLEFRYPLQVTSVNRGITLYAPVQKFRFGVRVYSSADWALRGSLYLQVRPILEPFDISSDGYGPLANLSVGDLVTTDRWKLDLSSPAPLDEQPYWYGDNGHWLQYHNILRVALDPSEDMLVYGLRFDISPTPSLIYLNCEPLLWLRVQAGWMPRYALSSELIL